MGAAITGSQSTKYYAYAEQFLPRKSIFDISSRKTYFGINGLYEHNNPTSNKVKGQMTRFLIFHKTFVNYFQNAVKIITFSLSCDLRYVQRDK